MTTLLVIGSGPGDPRAHTFGRGDYGAHYADDLAEMVQRWNCAKGCTEPTPEDVAEFGGPGGNCHLLIALWLEEPIPEFRREPERIVCTARIDPETVGMEPLL